jgi:hypothetical protein
LIQQLFPAIAMLARGRFQEVDQQLDTLPALSGGTQQGRFARNNAFCGLRRLLLVPF